VKFVVKLRRQSVQELLKEYQKLDLKSKVHKENYEKATKAGNTKQRLQSAKDMINNDILKYEIMIEVIKKFSPIVAKNLSTSLIGYKERVKDSLREDFANLPKLELFSEKQLDDLINTFIEHDVNFLKIHGTHIAEVFMAVSDTIKRTTCKIIEEKDESLKKLLQEIDPKYADMYEGAWQALESDNPERIRHSSSSLRKLVEQIVNLGAGKTRKEKVKSILKSKHETELVNALIDLVIALSGVLNKGVHEDLEFDTALFTMKITEYLLQYVLNRLPKDYTPV
jgi:hypothetical protein